jgi:hypothetical protein
LPAPVCTLPQRSTGTGRRYAQDFAHGGGIGVTLFNKLNTRLEYEVIDIGAVDDANAPWLSAAWRF